MHGYQQVTWHYSKTLYNNYCFSLKILKELEVVGRNSMRTLTTFMCVFFTPHVFSKAFCWKSFLEHRILTSWWMNVIMLASIANESAFLFTSPFLSSFISFPQSVPTYLQAFNSLSHWDDPIFIFHDCLQSSLEGFSQWSKNEDLTSWLLDEFLIKTLPLLWKWIFRWLFLSWENQNVDFCLTINDLWCLSQIFKQLFYFVKHLKWILLKKCFPLNLWRDPSWFNLRCI